VRVKELQEGFLDNIMSKIQTMAAGDGITGFMRSLAGSNARLDLVIDAIAGESARLLKQAGQTNLGTGSVGEGSAIPVDKIILACFSTAARLSKNQTSEIGEITRDGLFAHLRQHKTDILKEINVGAVEQAKAGQVANMVLQYVGSKKAPEPDPTMDFNRHINAVATVAAVTLLDWEFREMVGMGKGTNEPDAFKFDDATEKEFTDSGNKINTTLFTPGSKLHVALRANNDFKENVEKFIVDIVSEVQQKYVSMPTEQLKKAAEQPSTIVTQNEVQAAFLGHIDFSTQPPEYQKTVTDFVKKYHKNLVAFTGQWLKLAAAERDANSSDSSDEAFGLLHNWAKEALSLVDNIRVAKNNKPAQQPNKDQAGKDIPQAGEKPKVSIGGEEIKPTDPLYNKILDLTRTQA
jgi:hypothetical protein